MSLTGPQNDDTSLPQRFERFMSGNLLVSTGETIFVEDHRVSQPFRKGLTVAVALQGRMACRINDRVELKIEAPSVSLILTGADHQREQVFSGRQRLRYALVHLSPALIQSHLGLPFEALLDAGGRHESLRDPAFLVHHASPTIRSVASQLIVCPLQGATRSLFLIGKSLELVALALELCVPEAAPVASSRLTATEVEKLTAVRRTLLEQIAKPPPVARLAASAGLNTRALALGFRHLFGATVSEFIREQRLQLAYRIIATGEGSIAEAAYEVGYTPAYLSTLFRSRFGLPPSDLAAR